MGLKRDIVLIDDSDIANFIMRKIIHSIYKNVEMEEFTNPIEGLEYLKTHQPSIVFLDLNMPSMSGWQVLDELEKAGISQNVVILTSSISGFDEEKASKYSNVVHYLVKPITKEALRERAAPFLDSTVQLK